VSEAVYETVTVGLLVAVRAIVANEVGTTVSRVSVVVAVNADVGPAVPERSSAPLAAKRGVKVPLEQPVTVTVRVEPVSAPGAKAQPVAVPALEKSPAATPVTDSLKVSVQVRVVALVSPESAVVIEETEGAVRSMLTVGPVCCVAGPALPTPSATASAASRGISVPSEQPLTVTVQGMPSSLCGAKAQPVAVPVVERSPATRSKTCSEKTISNVCVAARFHVPAVVVNDATVGSERSLTRTG
jgi:hypothetical protein